MLRLLERLQGAVRVIEGLELSGKPKRGTLARMGDAVLEGELSGHSFMEVLQLSMHKNEKLKIELFDASKPFAEVYLDGCTLIEARIDSLSGIPALGVMLSMSEGHFRVSRGALSRPGTLNVGFDAAVFACAELADKVPGSSRKTLSSLPPTIIAGPED